MHCWRLIKVLSITSRYMIADDEEYLDDDDYDDYDLMLIG